jgi:uncharacterized protein YycO
LKKSLLIFGLLALIILCGLYAKRKFYDPKHKLENTKREVSELEQNKEIRNGDLIFQTSLSGQSKAIQLATKSKYSHCGLIFKEGQDYFVFEAIQPVKKTPLDKWIARGKDGHFVIKRVHTDPMLPDEMIFEVKKEVEKFIGKNYDLTFEWTDDKIYCSELIWKAYKKATGIEIGELETLADFDLTNEIVKAKMKERYGDKIPKDEKVISPKAIYESKLLETVKTN